MSTLASLPSRSVSLITPAAPPRAPDTLSANPAFPCDGFDEYTRDYVRSVVCDEECRLPMTNFLQYQTDLTSKMRATLVQWMLDIGAQCGLQRQTISLGVNLLDRYLSKRRVPKIDFQLVGIVAVFIASKYEETPARALTVSMACSLCCNFYTPCDISEMEGRLLSASDFDLEWRGPLALLDAFEDRTATPADSEPDADAECPDHRPRAESGAGADSQFRPAFRPPISRRDSGVDMTETPVFHAGGRPHFTPLATTAEDACVALAGALPACVVELARGLVEMSYLHSRFSGVRSPAVALGAVLAAEGMLEGAPGVYENIAASRLSALVASDRTLPMIAATLAHLWADRQC